ncbi:nucleoside 2-deoxyribosyltransferase [Marinobacter sediminum]|uniref:nucleoside 2-deoxyribosyltransferase n=1 Tax=Marinobacter sediminum TaxID=256323 RepID=UPI00202F37A5|nr:nucleoside 2-deoxyribosyltransferase [Marinobacter sediminum]MCM0612948.1 nucleoside 2-deoxyribosyltransferase [Marinobacter sediminum]
MNNTKRIYLAGPEVFFSREEHGAIVAEKKRILREHGFEGVDPLDTDLTLAEHESKQDHGFRIYRANRELMDSCDAIIANLTPFRGISADPGTVFEVGYIIGQGKPAFGFTLDNRNYRERAGSNPKDPLGYMIEDFELGDNLMIDCGIAESGGQIFAVQAGAEHSYFSSDVFQCCVEALKAASLKLM